MSVFGFKENKCKDEVYTKEEADAKLMAKSKLYTGTDLNDISDTCYYYCYSNVANIPISNTGYCFTQKADNATALQTFTAVDNSATYQRIKRKETWEEWVKVKMGNDYAVLTGSMTINASSLGEVTINYPSGFTSENCVPISCGISSIASKGYNYEGYYEDATDLMQNALKRTLNLTESNILLLIKNPATDQSKTVNYKIVLMKI